MEIFLKVDNVDWVELQESYKWEDENSDGIVDVGERNLVEGHTGYFYGANGATPTAHTPDATDGIDEYAMEVLINVHDWVGAYGCTYYMDAAIEIHFQIEVLQADYLDATKLGATGNAAWTGENGTVPGTIAELHEAWDKAVNYAQA